MLNGLFIAVRGLVREISTSRALRLKPCLDGAFHHDVAFSLEFNMQ